MTVRLFLFQIQHFAHEFLAVHESEGTVRGVFFGIVHDGVRRDVFTADRDRDRRAGMFPQMDRHRMIRQNRKGDAASFQSFHDGCHDTILKFFDCLHFKLQITEM